MKKAFKIIFKIIFPCVLAVILIVAAYLWLSHVFKLEKSTKYALVDRQLSLCQELITTKYRYNDIITIKKSLGFSKSYSLIKYTGVLYIGIQDFTDISYSISLDGNKIKVKIPQVQMLANNLISQEVFDEKQSIFVPITIQEVFDEIEQSKNETAQDLLLDGVLEESQKYANFIIEQFLRSCGFENIEITLAN